MTTTVILILLVGVIALLLSAFFLFSNQLKTLKKEISTQTEFIKQQENTPLQQLVSVLPTDNKPAEKELVPIQQFALTNAEGKQELVFNAINNIPADKKLFELSINDFNKTDLVNLMSGLQQIGTTTALLQYSASGLFHATGPVSQLMKLKSGGVGAAVLNNGKIVRQAGFVQAGSSAFTPLIVFQIAAIATGQYYLHGINKQLTGIQQKLDKLLLLFHVERQAKLKKSFLFLKELQSRASFEVEDFVLLRNIISDLADIREEYFLLLTTAHPELEAHKEKFYFRSINEVKKLLETFEKTSFFDNLEMSLAADKLYHIAKLIEFHMNISYKKPSENRIALIHEKLAEYSNISPADFQFAKTKQAYSEIKNNLFNQIKKAKSEAAFSEKDIAKIEDKLSLEFSSFERLKNHELSEMKSVYENITTAFDKPQSFIFDNTDSENPKIYTDKNI